MLRIGLLLSSVGVLLLVTAVLAGGRNGSFGAAPVQSNPVVCSTPLKVPAAVRTFSPQVQARTRSRTLNVAQHQQMFLEPPNVPYEFVLAASFQGLGYMPPPPVRRSSIRLVLRNSRGAIVDHHVHVLAEIPQPLQTPNPCGPSPSFRIGVRIDPAGLPADMYELQGTAAIDPFKLPDGTVVPATAALLPWRLYVPPPPDNIPGKRIGQKFLIFPDQTARYYDESGNEIPRRDVSMRVATLQRIDGDRLTFTVESFARRLRVSYAGPITQIPGLPALVDDANVRELNRKYDGKAVWGHGGLGSSCVLENPGGTFSAGGPNAKPYTVIRVFRLYRASQELAIGAYWAIGGERESAFISDSPLLVWLSVPKDEIFNAVAGTGKIAMRAQPVTGTPAPPPATPKPIGPIDACVAYYTYFADPWDMDRTYTLSPATQAHPEWGAAVLRAVMKGDVQKGMTRDQVAWALGYPDQYGPIAEFNRLTAWRYDDLRPFNYWVYFDANGRVTKFGPDGRLP